MIVAFLTNRQPVRQGGFMGMILLSMSHICARWAGIDRTVRWLSWLGQRTRKRQPGLITAPILAEKALSGMAYLPMRIECLEQSLAVWYQLNRYGHPAELKIGMRITPLSGHAWVVCEDQTYVQTPGLEDFTVVANYPPWAQSSV